MIARISGGPPSTAPEVGADQLNNESDVEQKYLLPFLCHPSFVGIPKNWVRTKEYMAPTEEDKKAGRKKGYIPDYSIWLRGLPIVIVEAKSPDVAIHVGLDEARSYAFEINKRYPPKVNPITFIVACNGREVALSKWDSEKETLVTLVTECVPGSAVLQTFQKAIGKSGLEALAAELAAHFETRPFSRVARFLGGERKLTELLGVNEFAQDLFPVLLRYFGNEAEEAIDEIIKHAFVSSKELKTYNSILETYLKDRVRLNAMQVQPIVTDQGAETGITSEIEKFADSPELYGRVQLIIGSVGAGKSIFIRRYADHLMPPELRERIKWVSIDFNQMPPGVEALQTWIADQFVSSFAKENNIDIYALDELQRIFSVELNRFERGPAKLIRDTQPGEYLRRKSELLTEWSADKTKLMEAVTRHYSGERGFGVVVVFDNVDRRSRDQQLAIFEAAQWLKGVTRSLVLVTLRDSTFEAHRDEPPLDAFVNAVNFYVRPPRFAKVIQKRLELVIKKLAEQVSKRQEYTLTGGARITYPASKLGKYLMSIYLSLFDRRSDNVDFTLEALSSRNVRRALGMFADIIVSPHIPTTHITGTILNPSSWRIPEHHIIRALMRGRYRYFNQRSGYIRNVLAANPKHERPSNFLYADILEFLIRNRRQKIDFTLEGYVLVETLIARMSLLGYDEGDARSAVEQLAQWGLIEPESLVLDKLTDEDAVRVDAAGYVHMKFLCQRLEYLVGISPDLNFALPGVAKEIADIWGGQSDRIDITLASKTKIAAKIADYFEEEYERRVKRHAFYREFGYGGRAIVAASQAVLDHLNLMKEQDSKSMSTARRQRSF